MWFLLDLKGLGPLFRLPYVCICKREGTVAGIIATVRMVVCMYPLKENSPILPYGWNPRQPILLETLKIHI